MAGRDCDVKLRASGHPEFDAWRWHDYWVPLDAVIDFKREVYRQALIELHRYLQADRRARARRPRGAPSPRIRSHSMDRDTSRCRSASSAPTPAFAGRSRRRRARVTPESPALQVMTDLARVSPATIRPQAPLAGANQFMITRGVRLLLVIDEHENILGLITATDLLSERPMRVAIDRGLRRDELTVGRRHDRRRRRSR